MKYPYDTFPFHPPGKKSHRYLIALGWLVTTVLVWWIALHRHNWEACLPLRMAFLAGSVLFFFLLAEGITSVNKENQTLCREGRLFGRILLWRRHHQISGFTSVRLATRRDPEATRRTSYVELLRPSGRSITVCYFHGNGNAQAQSAAWHLSQATGLPLKTTSDN